MTEKKKGLFRSLFKLGKKEKHSQEQDKLLNEFIDNESIIKKEGEDSKEVAETKPLDNESSKNINEQSDIVFLEESSLKPSFLESSEGVKINLKDEGIVSELSQTNESIVLDLNISSKDNSKDKYKDEYINNLDVLSNIKLDENIDSSLDTSLINSNKLDSINDNFENNLANNSLENKNFNTDTIKIIENKDKSEIDTIKIIEKEEKSDIDTIKIIENKDKSDIDIIKIIEKEGKSDIDIIKIIENKDKSEIDTIKIIEKEEKSDIDTIKIIEIDEDLTQEIIEIVEDSKDIKLEEFIKLEAFKSSKTQEVNNLESIQDLEFKEVSPLEIIKDSESGEINAVEISQDLGGKEVNLESVEIAKNSKELKKSWLSKFTSKISSTKDKIKTQLVSALRGRVIDEDLYEELEEILLLADIGIETTSKLIADLELKARKLGVKNSEDLYNILKEDLNLILQANTKSLELSNTPEIILVIGVNGAGKTTTIGKLASKYKSQNKKVVLGACDTFRAAAVEQLKSWGNRLEVDVINGADNSDSAAVAYNTITQAQKIGADVIILDTAGRLHNKENLMRELEKISRVVKKLVPEAPHETVLVLDSTTGQNAVSQVKIFNESLKLTGIILTKLDGTAKGGIIFSLMNLFQLPIYYIGLGESVDDLQEFNAADFIAALFE
ncbi:MAG: signal recognition particle-docking protein FtsY [Psittacicella sp.]